MGNVQLIMLVLSALILVPMGKVRWELHFKVAEGEAQNEWVTLPPFFTFFLFFSSSFLFSPPPLFFYARNIEVWDELERETEQLSGNKSGTM